MTTSKPLKQILLVFLLTALFPHLVFAADRAEKASGYYGDALVRMERKDTKGAIVQLKNALQQDSKMLPALVLLGKAYLDSGAPLGAERVLADAERLGADRSQIIAMQVEVYSLLGRNQALLERFSADGLSPDVKYTVLVTRGYAQIDLGQTGAAIQTLEQARQIDPNNPAGLVAQSMAYLRSGNFSDAAAVAQLAITKSPADPSGWNMKGSIAHAQGNVQDALAGYGKALALKPDYRDALIARASLQLDLNRNEEAVRDVATLKDKFPADPRSAYLQALLAGRQGKDTEARNALVALTSALDALSSEAVQTRPQLMLLGGIAHYSLGQNERAKTYLASYLRKSPQHLGASKIMAAILMGEKDYARAIALLDGPTRARPNDPQALSMLATAYMALGQHSRAVSLLEQASSMSGGSAPDITANFGLSLIGSGQEAQGMAQLQKAYAKNPGRARSGIPLAIMYLKQDQTKPAIQTLQAVTRNEPQNLPALNLLAVAQGLSKNLTGARKTYGLVLEKNPGFIQAKLNLARLDRYEGKPDDARRRLMALLKEQPKNPDALFELAQLELGAGRTQDAVRWLEKARSFNPRNLRPNLMLVDLYLSTGDVQKALDIAKETQASRRDNLPALAALGRCYLAIGNRSLARENFKRMTQLAGFDADWQQRAAELQVSAGDYEGARYSLDKALLSKPGYSPALLLKARLEKFFCGGRTTTNPNCDTWTFNNTTSNTPAGTATASGPVRTVGSANVLLDSAYITLNGSRGSGVRNNVCTGFANCTGGTSGGDTNGGISPGHAIDDNDRVDSTLFSFTDKANLTSFAAGWVQTDSDFTAMAYAGSGSPASLSGQSYSGLLSNGWSLIGNILASPSTGTHDFANSTYSSYWLIGALNTFVGGDPTKAGNDNFKLLSLAGCTCDNAPPGTPGCKGGGGGVPEPGTLLLIGAGLLGLTRLNTRRVRVVRHAV